MAAEVGEGQGVGRGRWGHGITEAQGSASPQRPWANAQGLKILKKILKI